jgi:hypothetical protein
MLNRLQQFAPRRAPASSEPFATSPGGKEKLPKMQVMDAADVISPPVSPWWLPRTSAAGSSQDRFRMPTIIVEPTMPVSGRHHCRQ